MKRITGLVHLALVSGCLVLPISAFSQTTLDQQIEELGLNVSQPEVSVAGSSQTNQPAADPDANAASGLVDNEIRVLLKPRSTTVLSAEAGGQIRSLPFDIGDNFGKGDELVKIGCSDTYSEISIAKARINLSKIENESNRSLLSQGGVSKFDVDLSGARVEEAEAVLKKYQIAAGHCILRAPYSGKVVARLTNRYEYVTSSQPIMEIIDDSKLHMQLYVPSIWITKIDQKSVFKVYIDEVDKEYEAEVIRINPRVDAGSKTLEIIAQLKEDQEELRAGMSGNARFDF
jgi:RND family efflux transporter MFP subunit